MEVGFINLSWRVRYVRNWSSLYKQEYCYTDFEPFYAHQLFPHFDQPSLKASFEVEITCPSDWACMTCTPLQKSSHEEGTSIWKSTESSPPLCSYLVPLIVGDYVVGAEGEAISGSKKVRRQNENLTHRFQFDSFAENLYWKLCRRNLIC